MCRIRRLGFSLIEILIVIGVIGVLLGLALSALRSARGAAERTGCANNLKQIGIALQNYHAANGRLPPRPTHDLSGGDPNLHLSWMALILPQLGQEGLYQTSVDACAVEFDLTRNPPHTGFATVVGEYVCTADGRLSSPLIDAQNGQMAAYASYVGIASAIPQQAKNGSFGPLGKKPGSRFGEITDGLSNTIMVGERPPPDSLQAGWWYPDGHGWGSQVMPGPNTRIHLGLGHSMIAVDLQCQTGVRTEFGPGRADNPCDRFHLWSLHSGGANFLFADGSVRFLSYSVGDLINKLGTIDGGEVVTLPE
ncbi:MAG TPA: DUF1559 domain-containing protein [Gemmataceae bacterium]|nr:DUF1559 domain-containing protein [Gemmataceae bacterium]